MYSPTHILNFLVSGAIGINQKIQFYLIAFHIYCGIIKKIRHGYGVNPFAWPSNKRHRNSPNTSTLLPLHSGTPSRQQKKFPIFVTKPKPMSPDTSPYGPTAPRHRLLSGATGQTVHNFWNNWDYRFSFNEKERDSGGVGGGGSTYDYGFRIYNAQIAEFLSVDLLTVTYPRFMGLQEINW